MCKLIELNYFWGTTLPIFLQMCWFASLKILVTDPGIDKTQLPQYLKIDNHFIVLMRPKPNAQD